MPEESTTPDVEALTRQITDALNRRDFDAAMARLAGDAVWDTSPIGMGVFEGRDAVRRACEDWIQPYADWEQQVVEVRDLGYGISFSVLHQRGRLSGGSGSFESWFGLVATSADGLVERFTTYTDIDKARAAAERLAKERG
jgi:ketosteroid isomerase-like protein